MSYSIGTEYYLVWLTEDEEVNNLLADLLPTYGFTLDSEHGCYYRPSDGLTELDLLAALETIDFDIDSNLWKYLYSYQIPSHF